MQGRSIETTIKVYLRKVALNKATMELAPFFKAYREAAKVHSADANLKVIDGGYKTHSGHCTANDNDIPMVDSSAGENSPVPRCGSPATLRSFHALHADEEDIMKLFSMKRWLELQGKIISRNIDEYMVKFGSTIDRIDLIVRDFESRSESNKQVVDAVGRRVEYGTYDEYWANKINALEDVAGV